MSLWQREDGRIRGTELDHMVQIEVARLADQGTSRAIAQDRLAVDSRRASPATQGKGLSLQKRKKCLAENLRDSGPDATWLGSFSLFASANAWPSNRSREDDGRECQAPQNPRNLDRWDVVSGSRLGASAYLMKARLSRVGTQLQVR